MASSCCSSLYLFSSLDRRACFAWTSWHIHTTQPRRSGMGNSHTVHTRADAHTASRAWTLTGGWLAFISCSSTRVPMRLPCKSTRYLIRMPHCLQLRVQEPAGIVYVRALGLQLLGEAGVFLWREQPCCQGPHCLEQPLGSPDYIMQAVQWSWSFISHGPSAGGAQRLGRHPHESGKCSSHR